VPLRKDDTLKRESIRSGGVRVSHYSLRERRLVGWVVRTEAIKQTSPLLKAYYTRRNFFHLKCQMSAHLKQMDQSDTVQHKANIWGHLGRFSVVRG